MTSTDANINTTSSEQSHNLSHPAEQTDMAFAGRFADANRGRLCYVPAWGKWLAWDGRRWGEGTGDEIERAKEVARQIEADAETIKRQDDTSNTQGEKLNKVAKYAASAKGINAMVSLSRSAPGICTRPDELNQQPYLLNVENGTLNLRSGEIRPHDPADRLTQLAPVTLDATATCPLWEQTVSQIFGGNGNVIGFVQRLLGTALLGLPPAEILPIFYGAGANGKTLLLETVLAVLGPDYGVRCDDSLLLTTRGDKHPTAMASLFGKRLALVSETAAGRKMDESAVKALTGRDTIAARRMREDFWNFSPTHTLILTTNHAPAVPHGGDAIWRRLRLVPFDVRFWSAEKGETGPPELQADPTLAARLRNELPGILNWLLLGCLTYQTDSLGQPAEVTAATAEYRDDQDVLAAWVEEELVVGNDARVCSSPAADVRRNYVEWCQRNGIHAIGPQKLAEYVGNLPGVQYRRSSTGRFYHGVLVRTRRHVGGLR